MWRKRPYVVHHADAYYVDTHHFPPHGLFAAQRITSGCLIKKSTGNCDFRLIFEVVAPLRMYRWVFFVSMSSLCSGEAAIAMNLVIYVRVFVTDWSNRFWVQVGRFIA